MSYKPGRVSRAIHRRLIEQLVHGERSPSELADEHEISLERLAKWSSDPANARVLAALSHLSDIRTQMLLSRYRANAAVQLINIATASQPTELSRKACVDLLKADLKVFRRDDEQVLEQAVDEHVIIRALEDLGREPDDA